MRRLYTVFSLFLVSALAWAQVYEPVKWSFSSEKQSADIYEIVMKATLETGWHLYSMDIDPGGPRPTSFSFNPAEDWDLVDKPFAITKPEVKFDESFGMDVGMYSGQAEFRQKISLKSSPVTVTGTVTFMSCDDSQCLPPRDLEFEVRIAGEKPAAETARAGESVPEGEQSIQQVANPPEIKVAESFTDNQAPAESKQKEGFLKFFLLSLIAGFAGVLTPCVFPMIPMTVAFFSQGSDKKAATYFKAFVFGLTIVLLYSSLGIIVSLTSAGAGFANTLSTHWIPNLLFFSLFIVFAISFFGAFEIVLPAKWVSTTDSRVDRGGVIAAFFLGVTTVLVSFSCTGPIVGALLVEAASGDVLRPTIGMFGFGLAFALPFTLFALFPSVMEKLPKSGGWLNSVKVVLAFIMLLFSLKFISAIDTVYSLGILSRDLFLSIWIVLFFLMGLYLMGKIRFAHDSDVKHIGVFRLFLIVASFTFALYLVPGLFGAPLKGISALLPPQETSGFNLMKTIGSSQVTPSPATDPKGADLCEEPKYAGFLHFENGLNGYFDLEQALACAREKNKPILIDFKGHACANCKEMDARVWSDPEVKKRLNENFVLVALYVDDRTKLEDDEVFVSQIDGKEKKTIGKKNEDIEISMFKTNTLPLYAIVDPSGKPLVETRKADFDIQAYIEWLDRGVAAYNK